MIKCVKIESKHERDFMQYISEEKRSIITFCTPAGRAEANEKYACFSPAVWAKIKQTLFKQQKNIVDLLYAQIEQLDKWFEHAVVEHIVFLRNTARVDFFLQTIEEQNVCVIVHDDTIFPKCLSQKLGKNCPEVLYMRGNVDLLLDSQKKISITGTRKCTSLSVECASNIARQAALSDVCTISGGAQGIDMAIHQFTLKSGGGTIIVLPYGLGHPDAYSLEEKLNGRYLCMTPFHMNDCFAAGRALYRNHLIYALGNQAIVVESGDGYGGTWNGANHALKNQYCPLYVVDEPRLNGNMRLITLQAKKYKKWDDHFGKEET